MCKQCHIQDIENFCHARKFSTARFGQSSPPPSQPPFSLFPSPHPHPRQLLIFSFAFTEFHVNGIIWHVVFCALLLYLTSFTEHNDFWTQALYCIYLSVVVPFYCYVVFRCHNLFIHSPVVNGYLDCYQFRAVTNEVTVNIHVLVFAGRTFSFILGRYLRVRYLSCMINECETL